MKHKKIELEVDFIGGEGSLTKLEEKIISEFLRRKKILRVKKNTREISVRESKKITT